MSTLTNISRVNLLLSSLREVEVILNWFSLERFKNNVVGLGVIVSKNRNGSRRNFNEHLEFMTSSRAVGNNHRASILLIYNILRNLLFVLIIGIFIRENVSVTGVKELLSDQDIFSEFSLSFLDLLGKDNAVRAHGNLDSFTFIRFVVMALRFEGKSEESK